MSVPPINNPFLFANAAIELTVDNIQQKVVSQPVPQKFLTPSHLPNTNQTYAMTQTDIAATTAALGNVVSFLTDSSYTNFVPLQVTAVQNTFNVFSNLTSVNNSVTLTPAQISDAIITYLAIFNLTTPDNILLHSTGNPQLIDTDITESAGFPSGATTVTETDGIFVVEQANTGNWFASAPQQGFSWDPVSSATMEAFSDVLVRPFYSSGLMILFGQQSIEYWQNQRPYTVHFPETTRCRTEHRTGGKMVCSVLPELCRIPSARARRDSYRSCFSMALYQPQSATPTSRR
jgi:hypothetical protein